MPKVKILISKSDDVYFNQAIELALFDAVKDNELYVFLWTNDKTVVIGRNQDAFCECRVEELEADGGKVARRLSGGGAVYHDCGNLNFTFTQKKRDFSVAKNYEVIKVALEKSGFSVEVSGRNDLSIVDRKFSGNAFFQSGENSMHHGTLLIATDDEAMKRYLTPERSKLAKRGVKSVQSRVVNLSSIKKDFDVSCAIDNIHNALIDIFSNKRVEEIDIDFLSHDELERNLKKFCCAKWVYGDNLCYNQQYKLFREQGLFDVRVHEENNVIKQAKVFTDSLDYHLALRIESALLGKTSSQQSVDIVLDSVLA